MNYTFDFAKEEMKDCPMCSGTGIVPKTPAPTQLQVVDQLTELIIKIEQTLGAVQMFLKIIK